MTRQVNIAEAKAKLSELVAAAAAGEEIVLARHGKPLARLSRLPSAKRKRAREFGQCEAEARHIDWDQWWNDWKAMDAEIEADFARSEIFPNPAANRGPQRPAKKRPRRA